MSILLDRLATSSQVVDELATLARRVQASVVVVRGTRSGGGSGVVWSDDGLIITNHHVVPGDGAEIELPGGARFPARTVARSSHDDLVALRADGGFRRAAQPATIGDSSQLRPGELVVAVGNPLGERNAITLGVVSGVPRVSSPDGEREIIQVAITLRPGNSGGALADVHGRVVGIPHMVVGNGAALAVPSSAVERLLHAVAAGRPHFGLSLRPVELPAALVSQHRLTSTTGLLVIDVESDSPADRAGMGLGDVLVATSGTPDVVAQLRQATVGVPTRFAVLRGGVLRWLEVAPRAA